MIYNNFAIKYFKLYKIESLQIDRLLILLIKLFFLDGNIRHAFINNLYERIFFFKFTLTSSKIQLSNNNNNINIMKIQSLRVELCLFVFIKELNNKNAKMLKKYYTIFIAITFQNNSLACFLMQYIFK